MNARLVQQEPSLHCPGGVPSAHTDQFIYTMMPPSETWPVFDYFEKPLCDYPDYMNAAEILLQTAHKKEFANKPAIHFDGETWTFRQLLEKVDSIARVLVEDYGLAPGNRVLMRSGNNPMLAACWLAVLKAGGICVTTLPLLKPKELVFILNRVRVRFALCEESLADDLQTAAKSAEDLERIAYFTPTGTGKSDIAEFDRDAANKSGSFRAIRTAADDAALIAFTSGTTGNPKATLHFHRDIIAINDCYPRVYTVEPDDIICGSPSLAFAYGIAVFLIYPLRYGATVVMVPRPTPELLLSAIERHRVNSVYGVPTSFTQMLEGVDQYDLSSLQKCASSGENLQMPIWEAWWKQTGIRLVNGYGSTEFMCTVLSDSLSVDRVGSSGKAVPGYTAMLVDPDGQALPINAKGRLAIRGPTGCRYLDDIEQQNIFVQDGWNVTSDVFVQDGDGYFWFVDRSDDIIVSSGYNISPQEVERALILHPMIRECAVVGVDDATRGKLVRACVVLHDTSLATQETAAKLQEFVKHRIAPYKYPRDVRFYDELPKTQTGKLQRHRLQND